MSGESPTLTREQERALIRAHLNGASAQTTSDMGCLLLIPSAGLLFRLYKYRGYSLTPAGRLLAQALIDKKLAQAKALRFQRREEAHASVVRVRRDLLAEAEQLEAEARGE